MVGTRPQGDRMSGSIIIGGTYFTDERINMIQGWFGADVTTVSWNDVDCGQYPQLGDWVFVLGIKQWVRRLKKARYTYPQIAKKVVSYIEGLGRPYGLLDDCNLDDERGIGDRLRMDLRPVICLLREYLEHVEYPSWVHPFSIPSPDLSQYKSAGVPISFCGAKSHPSRQHWIGQIREVAPEGSIFKLYKEGGKGKLPREEYLSLIGESKVSLSFQGNGYCCFRYQEIPAVGSCLASPTTPHVVRNDYVNGKHCIKFDTPNDILKKMDAAEDIAAAGHEHFLKYHTSEVRYNELAGYIDEVRRH